MSTLTTEAVRRAADGRRARAATDAVVRAYISDLARSSRPREERASARRSDGPARRHRLGSRLDPHGRRTRRPLTPRGATTAAAR